jgi:hypothetical protein
VFRIFQSHLLWLINRRSVSITTKNSIKIPLAFHHKSMRLNEPRLTTRFQWKNTCALAGWLAERSLEMKKLPRCRRRERNGGSDFQENKSQKYRAPPFKLRNYFSASCLLTAAAPPRDFLLTCALLIKWPRVPINKNSGSILV